jgi:membrane protease YdiL (CAAX protease family)
MLAPEAERAPPAPTATPTSGPDRFARREGVAVAVALTLAASAVPGSRTFAHLWSEDVLGLRGLPWPVFHSFALLAFGLLLALPTRERSGLRVGAVREHWPRVLLVCGLPPLLAALVYPNLPVRPFSGAYVTMWLVSPLAQTLVFQGFLYGYLEPRFPEYVHPRVPVRWALVIVMLLFAFWHVPNFLGTAPRYVWFQLFYTGVLGIVPALSRQWTGSIWYAALCHSAVNFVAWAAS